MELQMALLFSSNNDVGLQYEKWTIPYTFSPCGDPVTDLWPHSRTSVRTQDPPDLKALPFIPQKVVWKRAPLKAKAH